MTDGPITAKTIDVGRIGDNLAILAREKDTIGNGEFGTVRSLDLSFGDESGTDAQKAVHAICQTLSLSEITKSGATWQLGTTIGPNQCDDIKNKFDVKIVFEEPGQAILLAPDKNNLEFGLQNPPMHEFDYIIKLPGVQEAIKKLLLQLSGQIKELSVIVGTDIAIAVENKTDEFISEHPVLQPLSMGQKVEMFHEQLGAYASRQCG